MASSISGTTDTEAVWCPEEAGQSQSQRQTKRNHHDNTHREETEVREEQIDPCKVFVTNLRPGVSERALQKVMSHYASVEKVIIVKDKHTRRSRGYGFVKVKTEEDVERLLGLSEQDRYIRGKAVTIKRAWKKVAVPGDVGYVRRPLPERDFDMENPDPTQPSIHMLVDDVIFMIFSYLPIKNLVRCERVCRRWQMLLYQYFTKVTKLDISEISLGICPPITKSIVSKLLILAGPNLRDLTVDRVDFATRQNILVVISQLCPELEYLDVSKTRGINYTHISKLAQGCKNIKGFVARNCDDFNGQAFRQLLVSYPQLEKLDLAGTYVSDTHLKLLPSTMKELFFDNISESCKKPNAIMQIVNRCPNLEVMELPNLEIHNVEDLEHMGKQCPNLTKLKICVPLPSIGDAMAHFKKLKDLTLVDSSMELGELCTNLPQLEVLTLDTDYLEISDLDFSDLKNLRILRIRCEVPTCPVAWSLSKCKNLEELHVKKLHEEVVLQVIQGCQKIRVVTCPYMHFSLEFLREVEKVMETRPNKLVIEALYADNLTKLAEYDKRKIELIKSAYTGIYLVKVFL